MPFFRYIAKSSDGKSIHGVLESHSKNEVIDSLRSKNLVIVSILETKPIVRSHSATQQKIKLEDLVVFSRQLATMVEAGITLVQALDILSEQIEKESFRNIIKQMRNEVESGQSLSEGLAKHPKVFSKLFTSMVRAGETSGMLSEILDRLAVYLEKTNSLQRKVKSSLVYPMVVSAMAIIITLFLILKVIPTFKGIFASLGGTLPIPTQLLISFSDAVRHHFLLGVIVLVFSGICFLRYIRTEAGRRNFDRTLLKLPVFGPLFRKVAVAKFTRTLSTLIKSGVPILASFDIVGETAGNKVVEDAVKEARAYIREGEDIASPLAASGVFPPMVVRMIAVGEKSGQLEAMLTKIADFYEDEVDAAVSGLTSMIEPLIIAFLGIVIGYIVVAMFMPIFKLTELIG